jgi:hypothetical protein
MPCKVIPFPERVGVTRAEPILARHHVILEVGGSAYEMDVMAFVKPLRSSQDVEGTAEAVRTGAAGTERQVPILVEVLEWSESLGQGWRAVLRLGGSKRQWEAYWRGLGIALPSSGEVEEKKAQNSLALRRQQSDESSCATSAAKETNMTNAENQGTALNDGTAGELAAERPAQCPRPGQRAKGSPARRKLVAHGGSSGGSASRRTATKSGKKVARRAPQKPRAESKAAKILQLIGRAQGATLGEIMRATGWQAHSVRGFLSTAAKKQQLPIASSRNEAGQRIYKAER